MFPLSKWHAAWLAVAVLVCIVAAVSVQRRRASAPDGPIRVTSAPVSPSRSAPISRSASGRLPDEPSTGSPIYVHVSGHVARPGLYRLAYGARVMDAITGAGGATGEANLEALNLATPLHDGQKLLVPSYGEPPPAPDPGYLVDSPPPPAAVLVRPDPVQTDWPDSERGGAPYAQTAPVVSAPPVAPEAGPAPAWERPSHAASASTGKLKTPGEGVVNINRAGASELQRLPGVGPSTARKILDYRSAHGGFRTVEELMEVKGIGEKKLEKMAPFVVL